MASERRQFLNKINKRIYTLTKHGVPKSDILDIIKPKLPSGAYITEFGQINVDPAFWNQNKSDIMEALDEKVEMYWNVKEKAIKPYREPISKEQADKEVRAYMQYVKELQDFIDYYYDVEREFRDKGMSYLSGSEEVENFKYLVEQEGSVYQAGEIPYSKRMAGLERMRSAKAKIGARLR